MLQSLVCTSCNCKCRAAVGFLLLPGLLGASAAFAKDPEKTGSASSDRKEALRETAQEIKRTGEDKDPFPGNTFGMTDSTHGGKDSDKFPRQVRKQLLLSGEFQLPPCVAQAPA